VRKNSGSFGGWFFAVKIDKAAPQQIQWMNHWPAAQTSSPWFVEGGLGVYFYGCGLQSGADKKSATSRVSWRPECVWKRLQTTSGAKKTGISGLISGEAFYFWYGLA